MATIITRSMDVRLTWQNSGDAATRGFTPLEVLIAFVIISVALAVLLRRGAAAMSNVEASVCTERAVSLAQSQHLLCNPNVVAEDLQGDEGDYH